MSESSVELFDKITKIEQKLEEVILDIRTLKFQISGNPDFKFLFEEKTND